LSSAEILPHRRDPWVTKTKAVSTADNRSRANSSKNPGGKAVSKAAASKAVANRAAARAAVDKVAAKAAASRISADQGVVILLSTVPRLRPGDFF
jgi:hypothetical protein